MLTLPFFEPAHRDVAKRLATSETRRLVAAPQVIAAMREQPEHAS
jgi:hypothetical protein